MSQIYIQEPPTTQVAVGRVVLHTTAGEIDIELWCKEAPKACRNFIQLCIEGYYEDVIFHRVVPDFLVQGGDPTGTGMGGESVYGDPFEDEFHSRLRFTRRGLVGMASSARNDNTSQFFITLGATPELQNKHTLFGRVVGNTLYNVVNMVDLKRTGERPLKPPKILSAEVKEDPFGDIQPRTTAAAKRAAREAAEQQRHAAEAAKKRLKKGVKDNRLLSFGADEEMSTEATIIGPGKIRSSHDILSDPRLSQQVAVVLDVEKEGTKPPAALPPTRPVEPASEAPARKTKSKPAPSETPANGPDSAMKKSSVQDEIAQVKESLRTMEVKRKQLETGELPSDAAKNPSWLEETLAKYKQPNRSLVGGRKKRRTGTEDSTMAKLNAFTAKLTAAPIYAKPAKPTAPGAEEECELHHVVRCESCRRSTGEAEEGEATAEREVEFEGDSWDDSGWLDHQLVFEKDTKGKDLMKRRDNIDDFVVIDPRVRRAQAERKESERIQKQKDKGRGGRHRPGGGGGGSRRH